MKPQDPSALHILAFVYLTFSHVTDGELSREEVETIARVLHGWLPEANDAVISRVISESASGLRGSSAASAGGLHTTTSCGVVSMS